MDLTKCYAPVRGSVIRVTRLDAAGVPIEDDNTVVTSKRVSTVTIDEVSEGGTNIRERNFGDELCIVDDAPEQTIGFGVAAQFCGVDPALVTAMTGQQMVKNADGDYVGFDADSGIDLDSFAFSLEVWSRIAGNSVGPGGHRLWGYTVFPYVKGGRLGGFSFENGPITFSMQGATTREGNSWGSGPFDVDRGVGPGFAPAPLFTPLRSTTHFRSILVSLDPPAAACGGVALPAA